MEFEIALFITILAIVTSAIWLHIRCSEINRLLKLYQEEHLREDSETQNKINTIVHNIRKLEGVLSDPYGGDRLGNFYVYNALKGIEDKLNKIELEATDKWDALELIGEYEILCTQLEIEAGNYEWKRKCGIVICDGPPINPVHSVQSFTRDILNPIRKKALEKCINEHNTGEQP